MYVNFDRLLYLSILFALLFCAFNIAANLCEKVLRENDFGNLGFYILGMGYLFCGLSAIFVAAPIIDKIGDKYAFFLGSLGYSAYVWSFILPAFRSEHPDSDSFFYSKGFIITLMLLVAAIEGALGALLWTV